MNGDAIDRTVFEALEEAMGEEFVQDLVDTFLTEAPGMLGDLRTAAEAEDTDSYRRAAHSIKSNAEIFGAQALADLARQMELSGIAPDAGTQHAALAILDAEYLRTSAILKDLASE